MQLVPNSWGSLREYNQCHAVDGRFCSGPPRGLVKGAKQPSAMSLGGGQSSGSPRSLRHLAYDLARAQRLGIDVPVTADPDRASATGRALAYQRGGPAVVLELPKYSTGTAEPTNIRPHRGDDLTVLRHEIGHVTDRGYGVEQKPAQHRIGGAIFPLQYVQEFGAWRAAIRDAPRHRVRWPRVRRSLLSYLKQITAYRRPDGAEQAVSPALAERLVDQHVRILRRYAQRLQRGVHQPRRAISPYPGEGEVLRIRKGGEDRGYFG